MRLLSRLRFYWHYHVRHRGDFITAYRTDTDARVATDAHSAIGGLWEELGELQFDFLRSEGLRPEHRLLDIGCGTLRGGLRFIGYLAPGGYTGLDISSAAIEEGRAALAREGLESKRPRLLVNDNLRFEELSPDDVFDFVLAQSVFTHLPDTIIDECLANVSKVMKPGATFYFTCKLAETARSDGYKEFWHPQEFFETCAARHGLRAELKSSEEYPHPRGQRMFSARLLD